MSEFCEKERVRRRDFRYTCQIITHDVIRRKSSRDGNCRVTHVRTVMHIMTHLCTYRYRIHIRIIPSEYKFVGNAKFLSILTSNR